MVRIALYTYPALLMSKCPCRVFKNHLLPAASSSFDWLYLILLTLAEPFSPGFKTFSLHVLKTVHSTNQNHLNNKQKWRSVHTALCGLRDTVHHLGL